MEWRSDAPVNRLSLAEIRKKIAESIASTFETFVHSERRSVERALSLLASDRTIHPRSMQVILDFYNRGEDHKEAFFATLASLEPRRVDFILNQIYAAMGTPEWLITLRKELNGLTARMAKEKRPEPSLKPLRELAEIFTEHFVRIFNFQYLVTRCCNAQNTSIALLKFISEKEGVHPAEHWWNFENRLNSPDHIIITLEHFKMPYIPLVYVEVALSKGLIRKMSRIIGDKHRPADVGEADTAIFYSLNTTLAGLDGIALGAKMIIRAREYIEANYPNIRNFATLSPIPKFREYLTTVLKGEPHDFSLTKGKIDINKHGRFLSEAEAGEIRAELSKRGDDTAALPLSGLIRKALEDERWHENAALRRAMKHPMTELTTYYLTREKRTDKKTKKRKPNAYDPVANFHLSNGAFIGGIDYLANTSERGMKESFGMMVNYIYDAARQENNKLFYRTGRVAIRL